MRNFFRENYGKIAAAAIGFFVIFFVIVPVVRFGWSLRQLENMAGEKVIQAELNSLPENDSVLFSVKTEVLRQKFLELSEKKENGGPEIFKAFHLWSDAPWVADKDPEHYWHFPGGWDLKVSERSYLLSLAEKNIRQYMDVAPHVCYRVRLLYKHQVGLYGDPLLEDSLWKASYGQLEKLYMFSDLSSWDLGVIRFFYKTEVYSTYPYDALDSIRQGLKDRDVGEIAQLASRWIKVKFVH